MSNKPFKEWFNEQFPFEDERRYNYMNQHYVPDEDSAIENFRLFFEARRELIEKKLYEIVGL